MDDVIVHLAWLCNDANLTHKRIPKAPRRSYFGKKNVTVHFRFYLRRSQQWMQSVGVGVLVLGQY